jgi:hypothetical protein
VSFFYSNSLLSRDCCSDRCTGSIRNGPGYKSKELYQAVTAVLPVLANIISSGEPDVQTVARRVLEAGTLPVALNLSLTDSPLLPQPSAFQHSQGQLPGQEYGSFRRQLSGALVPYRGGQILTRDNFQVCLAIYSQPYVARLPCTTRAIAFPHSRYQSPTLPFIRTSA